LASRLSSALDISPGDVKISPMTDKHSPRKLNRRHFLTGAGAVALLSALEACSLETSSRGLPRRPFRPSSLLPSARAPLPPPRPHLHLHLHLHPVPPVRPTPTGTSILTATPTASAVASPTGKSTAKPTATATPSATPTPTPTPYPPGPPSKLGLFTTRADGQINTLIQVGKPALIKTLNLDPNFARFIKENSPTTIVVDVSRWISST